MDDANDEAEHRSTLPVWVSWASAIGAAVWGLVLLGRPSDSSSTTARLVGVGLVILGLTFALRSVTSRQPVPDRVDAASWLAVGTVAIAWPDPTVRGLVLLCGAALVVTGAVELVAAFGSHGDERVRWGIGAITSIALGVAALAWPSATTLVLSIVVGLRLLVAATASVADAVRDDGPDVQRRRGSFLRTSASALGLALALGAAGVAVFVHRAQPDGPPAFYDAPDTLPGPPGTLIRSERVDPFVPGATAHRVLYVTSDTDGAPTTSSGLIIVPDGDAPPGGRPVLAFTHGTVGIARSCALSLLPGDVYGPAIPGIREFLDAGFVVAATDYAGLGSDATTGYLVGSSQAYSTLDAVRVAVAMPEVRAAARFVSFGESQGGHASLFTGQFAAAYAPELELAGVAAAAPATDLTSLFQANVGTTFGDVLASYALASWEDVYGAAVSDIAVPQAVPVIERLADVCIQNTQQMLSVLPEAELLKIAFLAAPPWDTEPWASIIAANTPGGSTVDAPVLIAQGAADPLVVPDVQQAFVDRWCAAGQTIEYRLYEGVGHLDAGHASAADVAAWAVDRFAGEPWTSATC